MSILDSEPPYADRPAWVVVAVVFVVALPRNDVGKVVKRELAALAVG